MAELFAWLGRHGFAFNHFASNGILLPAKAGEARISGLALHRGPHPGYNAIVLERIERIRIDALGRGMAGTAGGAHETIWRLRLLQRALRRTLDGSAPRWVWLNRRDPMRLYADAPALDRQIYAMFGA